MDLQIAQVIERTEAEGPGLRFAVWVQTEEGTRIAVEDLALRVVHAAGVEGITLLGGEPFAQAEGCARFAEIVQAAGLSVMVFTGYTLAELDARAGEPGVADLLAACDLLVDGRFDATQVDDSRRWVGSKNQVLHFRTTRYSPTDPRFQKPSATDVR